MIICVQFFVCLLIVSNLNLELNVYDTINLTYLLFTKDILLYAI